MILYTLAIAFLIGLVRWRVWILRLFVIVVVVVQLGIGSEWNFTVWKPFSNPIFVDLVLRLLLASYVASEIGYALGRFIAFITGYLARSFRTPME